MTTTAPKCIYRRGSYKNLGWSVWSDDKRGNGGGNYSSFGSSSDRNSASHGFDKLTASNYAGDYRHQHTDFNNRHYNTDYSGGNSYTCNSFYYDNIYRNNDAVT